MNERIKELLVTAIKENTPDDADKGAKEKTLMRFAELVIEECMRVGRLAQINNRLVDSEIKDHFGEQE